MVDPIKALTIRLKYQKIYKAANWTAISNTNKRIQALEKMLLKNAFKAIREKEIAVKTLQAQKNIIKALYENDIVFNKNIDLLQKEIDEI